MTAAITVRAPGLRGHGLMPTEEVVMALHDAGHDPAAIAIATDRSQRTVEITIARYQVGAQDSWAIAARRASAALLTAIRRHHPETCGAAS